MRLKPEVSFWWPDRGWMRRRGGSWFGNPERAPSEMLDLAAFLAATGPLTMHQAAAWLGGPKGQAMASLNRMAQRQWLERLDWAAARSPEVQSTSVQRLVTVGPGALISLRRNPTGKMDGWRVCVGAVAGQLLLRLRGATWAAAYEDSRNGLAGRVDVGGGRSAWVVVLRRTISGGSAYVDRVAKSVRERIPRDARVWLVVPADADMAQADKVVAAAALADRALTTTDARLWDRARPASRMFLARGQDGWKPIGLSALEAFDHPVQDHAAALAAATT